MIKTAEEILLQCCAGPEASPVWSHEEALDAMRKFATQEVEAYKKRLKEFVEDQYFSNSSLESFSLFHIQQLIDTVK